MPVTVAVNPILMFLLLSQCGIVLGGTAIALWIYMFDPRRQHIWALAISYGWLTCSTVFGLLSGTTTEPFRISMLIAAYALGDYGLLRLLALRRHYLA